MHNVPAEQVRRRLAPVEISPALGQVVEGFLQKAIEAGFLRE